MTLQTTDNRPLITLLVAMASNRCIGIDNKMPWHISEDFKHFKRLTIGKPCIMGRKTFESIVAQLGKPLPGRENLIVSRSGFSYEGAHSYVSLEDAIEAAKTMAEKDGLEEICVVGGAQIYAQALPFADRLELTLVHKEVEGDAFFPEFSVDEWQEVWREDHKGDPAFSFTRLQRLEALG